MRFQQVLFTMAFTTLAGSMFPSFSQDAPIEIGGRLELFVDHLLIDKLDGTALTLHEPRPAEVAIRFDKPWEGVHCGYPTVFRDGDKVRLYYRGMPLSAKDGTDIETTCYAESPDGIVFTKPELGLFEEAGGMANNVILAHAVPFSHNFAPWPDARPGAPDDERYKALAGTSESGLVGFVSGDGIHWRKLREEPLITKGAFDSQNVCFWSESEQCYVAYFRTWTEGTWGGCRWVSRATSPDFLVWSEPVPMDKGDAPWENIYTNQTVPYYRAPHIYISIAARFMPGRRVASEAEADALGVAKGYSGDCSDNVLMTSRGENRYDRTFMEGFIKPGIGLENWMSRTNYPARGILDAGNGEMSVYIQEGYSSPDNRLRRYVLREDGFVSVRAPYAGGEMVTKPLVFAGSELHLNFATSAAGEVRVEIQDAAGTPLPGYALEDSAELIGNMIERTVRWKDNADVSKLAGTPVRLRFAMKDADLYAIQFK